MVLWWTITEQRKGCHWTSGKPAVLALSFITFYRPLWQNRALCPEQTCTQGIYSIHSILFRTHRAKQDETQRQTKFKGCSLAHIHVWVIVYSSCAVIRKQVRTQWRYAAPDNGIRHICLNKRQSNDERPEQREFSMLMSSSDLGQPPQGVTLFASVTHWIMSQVYNKWYSQSWNSWYSDCLLIPPRALGRMYAGHEGELKSKTAGGVSVSSTPEKLCQPICSGFNFIWCFALSASCKLWLKLVFRLGSKSSSVDYGKEKHSCFVHFSDHFRHISSRAFPIS